MKLLHVQTIDRYAAATLDATVSPESSSAEIIEKLRSEISPDVTSWTDTLSRCGWSASIVILNATSLLSAQSRELGLATNAHPHEAAHHIIAALTPDVVLFDCDTLHTPGFVTSLANKPPLTVGWLPGTLSDRCELRGIDLILTPQASIRSLALSRGARNATDFYVGVSLHEIKALQRPSHLTDVVFCGHYDAAHRQRNQLLLDLSKGALGWHGGYSTQFFLCGSFDRELLPIGVAMHAQEDCSRRARLDALIGAKVAIHAFSDAPQPDEFDPYIFEATAAGAVVLTSSPAAISRFFRPDHEIETFGSSEEMMRKLRRILDDQPYRTHVAAAGQRRSLTEHSVEARMEALSSLLRQHLQ